MGCGTGRLHPETSVVPLPFRRGSAGLTATCSLSWVRLPVGGALSSLAFLSDIPLHTRPPCLVSTRVSFPGVSGGTGSLAPHFPFQFRQGVLCGGPRDAVNRGKGDGQSQTMGQASVRARTLPCRKLHVSVQTYSSSALCPACGGQEYTAHQPVCVFLPQGP